jgi:A/G-specific adenine glycosylase
LIGPFFKNSMARTTKSNIEDFQRKILKWYEANGRNFPWRVEGLDSYTLIVTEILLQRTKAETVNLFYAKFLSKYPNWPSVSRSSVAQIANVLKPLGLFNQRANRLKKLADVILKRKGKLPETRTELDEMPFIGQYIGNAIELLIYKRPLPLLDVNMARVLERYFGDRQMADIRYDPYLQKLSHRIVNHQRSRDISWAILDFAAIICSAQRPKCEICIIALKCTYYKNL